MVRRHTRAVGSRAEISARQHLEGRGLVTIETNFHRRFGEIDLIMRDGNCLVFVEVRYRSSRRVVAPGTTVDIHKQRKLIRTAALYVARHPEYALNIMRFDVVAIDDDGIDWIADAFRPSDSAL